MLSIITAVYNRLDLTQAFLRSLCYYSPPEPWELIWVDDGSTDGTREWLQTLNPSRHRVILNHGNFGFASNNNSAARLASGDTLVLLNNDILLTPGWFEPLINCLSTSSDVGVVGNVQLVPATGLIDHAGVFFDLVGRPGHLHKGLSRDTLRGNGISCAAVTAACWMLRKEVFLLVGGFHEQYLNGFEDIDFCLRLKMRGYRHWVDYRSVIWHHVSSSPGRSKHNAYNEALFLKRRGEQTSKFGERDWPRQYLGRVCRQPRQLNATKTLDALLRLARLRQGDSAWAKDLRQKIIAAGKSVFEAGSEF